MENLALALLGPPSAATCLLSPRRQLYAVLSSPARRRRSIAAGERRFKFSVSAPEDALKRTGIRCFASVSSSNSSETSTVTGVPQQLVPPQSSSVGSPLFWIGVGVGLSALFSVVASRVKSYMMQQAFKSMMGQMAPQNGQNAGSPFFPGAAPFPYGTVPFPSTPQETPSTAPHTQTTSKSTVTVDVSATEVHKPPSEVSDESEIKNNAKKYAFVDVSTEEVLQKDSYVSSDKSGEASFTKDVPPKKEVAPNGAAVKQEEHAFNDQTQTDKPASELSVDALEKMLEDPTVQKMVYPYLPEEMRNPETFKWMLQNPQYRQQLQDMLNNMGGGTDWDSRMVDSLKNFDLSSPEVKQQFDQIGLSPEEVISKIMANPDVAMAFQNPKVQAAIMECSQNPLSIAKYQNDKEVMDVFRKISELFPGVTGYP